MTMNADEARKTIESLNAVGSPVVRPVRPDEPTRAVFETWFARSRRNRGANKRPDFARLQDGTYADDHTQRHWWTWQMAQNAARGDIATWLEGQGQPGYAHEVRHRA